MGVWTVYFDGLCEPRNPGGVMGWGYAIDRDGELATNFGAVAKATQNTNNIAEYYALGFALRSIVNDLKKNGPGKFAGLSIRGDSKLVVSQINGLWQVKAEHLQPLHARCLALLAETGQPWSIEWIPRQANLLADSLSRRGYRELTGEDPPERTNAA